MISLLDGKIMLFESLIYFLNCFLFKNILKKLKRLITVRILKKILILIK